jgi:predicted short-subunit dehydrogenase-like oxidoreductase (DUF2520 family)
LIVGRGRLGTALARALGDRDFEVTVWRGRGRWPGACPPIDAALVAVADPFVYEVAQRLDALLPAHTPLLHVSGSLGAVPLARPSAVAHPLVSFASARAPTLEGATLVVAGHARARAMARRIGAALGMRVVTLGAHGPRYHASAALVANGAAALAAEGVRGLRGVGFSRREAERAIAALLRSVAENVAAVGVPRALTGPIVRGDARAVAAHRAVLDARALRTYDAIAPAILDLARESGVPRARARAVERELTRDRGTRRARRG